MAASSATSKQTISVSVFPTTGGQIDLTVSDSLTITNFKKLIGNKLKISRNRIVLLLKNKQLAVGTLASNRVTDGAKLTLLPSVETGLSVASSHGSSHHHQQHHHHYPGRPDHNVRQALETLSDHQVENFLNGKAPLNLTMRLGDHMMFIQLQLSSSGLTTPPLTPTSPSAPASTSFSLPTATTTASPPSPPPSPLRLNTKALSEASQNLNHTLRKLSSATRRVGTSQSLQGQGGGTNHQSPPTPGAVIETMYHHGSGVYSGTFSGTLSHMSDGQGRPRRDVSTILHILNDLLGATSNANALQHHSTTRVQPAPPANPSSQPDPSKERENSVTRDKVVRLQMMLEERRKLRRARKRFSPYPTSVHSNPARNFPPRAEAASHPETTSSTTTTTSTTITSSDVNSPSQSSPDHYSPTALV